MTDSAKITVASMDPAERIISSISLSFIFVDATMFARIDPLRSVFSPSVKVARSPAIPMISEYLTGLGDTEGDVVGDCDGATEGDIEGKVLGDTDGDVVGD